MSDITDQKLYAGDTIDWEESNSDYPVTTHTIKYLLQRTNEAPKETAHSVSGSNHKFTVTLPTTGGTYRFQKKAILTSDSSQKTIDDGFVEIEATLADGTDNRSYNKQVLEALKAAQLGYATREQIKIEVSGRAIEYYSPKEREDLIDTYEAKVKQEERIENGLSGIPQVVQEIGVIT